MSSETNYRCDVCGKPIKGCHQLEYMTTVTVVYPSDDDGCSQEGTITKIYHIHNDLTNCCMRKIWSVFKKEK